MGNIAAFMNQKELGSLDEGMTMNGGVPVMATPAVAVPAAVKITAGVVAFTVPVAAYVLGRVVN
ncbi:hypothetical protein ACIF80_11210 [Streptomyces sp. NPDC085927]|uniref:hypothetical protein n=1 Tax=Streptomyces sp. NPDC085927 TaxID=3365738 RepID=UPI0037D21D7A